jgi:3-deoxy-D-manno-octulosonic-acid transferase
MARSLSLSALMALRRGSAVGAAPPPGERPRGALVWAHCPDPARLSALAGLATQLRQDSRVTMLVTFPGQPPDIDPPDGLILRAAPPDLAAPVRAFLDHWRPDLVLWTEGAFRPVLLAETDRLGVPRLLADARAGAIGVEGGSWMPGVTRALVDRFDRVLAVDQDAAQRLRKAGLPPDRIEIAGALVPAHAVPPCNERERRDLAALLGPRPVWLAADVPQAELAEVIGAAQEAMKRSHRLLLLLAPALPVAVPEVAALIRASGLAVGCRSEGAEPEADIEVYLADQPGEAGLWYRLAPVTYMGGTLSGRGGAHPFDPAVLGSAVLHGPAIRPWQDAYGRLSRAGAARLCRSGADLGVAVESLISPDRAAAMAHAAWDVTTAGAEVGARLTDLIRAALSPPGAAA